MEAKKKVKMHAPQKPDERAERPLVGPHKYEFSNLRSKLTSVVPRPFFFASNNTNNVSCVLTVFINVNRVHYGELPEYIVTRKTIDTNIERERERCNRFEGERK